MGISTIRESLSEVTVYRRVVEVQLHNQVAEHSVPNLNEQIEKFIINAREKSVAEQRKSNSSMEEMDTSHDK